MSTSSERTEDLELGAVIDGKPQIIDIKKTRKKILAAKDASLQYNALYGYVIFAILFFSMTVNQRHPEEHFELDSAFLDTWENQVTFTSGGKDINFEGIGSVSDGWDWVKAFLTFYTNESGAGGANDFLRRHELICCIEIQLRGVNRTRTNELNLQVIDRCYTNPTMGGSDDCLQVFQVPGNNPDKTAQANDIQSVVDQMKDYFTQQNGDVPEVHFEADMVFRNLQTGLMVYSRTQINTNDYGAIDQLVGSDTNPRLTFTSFRADYGDETNAQALSYLVSVLLFLAVFAELFELWVERKNLFGYISNFWNVLDFLTLTCQFCTLVFWFIATGYLDDAREAGFLARSPQKPDIQVVSENFQMYIVFAGLSYLGLALRFFKYFDRTSRVGLFVEAVRRSARDLFHFVFVLLIVILGYMFMGALFFGNISKSYNSYSEAFKTLMQMLFGEFDYGDLERASSFYGGKGTTVTLIFFWTYIIIVVLILVNMFIAIVLNAYDAANESDIREDSLVSDIVTGIRERNYTLLYLAGKPSSGFITLLELSRHEELAQDAEDEVYISPPQFHKKYFPEKRTVAVARATRDYAVMADMSPMEAAKHMKAAGLKDLFFNRDDSDSGFSVPSLSSSIWSGSESSSASGSASSS